MMDERALLGRLPEHLVGGAVRGERLRELGLTEAEIGFLARRGVLRPVRRGWYGLRTKGPVRPEDAHRVRILAAVGEAERQGRELMLAGVSAALWWGPPWLGPDRSEVTVSCPTRSGTSVSDLVRRLPAPPVDRITTCRGVQVTDVARTVVDVARTCEPRLALTVVDAALHRGMTDAEDLEAAARGAVRLRGVRWARWCIARADGRAESPGESVSRCAMILADIPLPSLQVAIRLLSGAVARVDFLWEADRPIGEFDGLLKYRAQPGRPDPRDASVAEKLREDQLREAGYRVARWTWQDARSPGPWLDRLRPRLPRSLAAQRNLIRSVPRSPWSARLLRIREAGLARRSVSGVGGTMGR